MLTYLEEDLLKSSCPYIAHGCNSSARFGSGVAAQIAKKFPWAEGNLQNAYRDCVIKNGTALPPGSVFLATNPNSGFDIFNCVTQAIYGRERGKRYVSYDALDECFLKISKMLRRGERIGMPKIGAGLGGGNWDIIEQIILHRLGNFNVIIYLGKDYAGIPHSKQEK